MNTNTGRFFALKWSKDWDRVHPWSLSGKITPYVGYMVSDKNPDVSIFTLGPLAIVIINIRKKQETPK